MITRRELLQRCAGAIIGVAVSPALIESQAIGVIGGARIGLLRKKVSPFTWDPVKQSLTLRWNRPMAQMVIAPGGVGTIFIYTNPPERYLLKDPA